jgi:acyl carrier protein
MQALEDELKKLIVEVLDLEDIEPGKIDSEEPLFGDGLGLDSIDGLELGMALRKRYGVSIDSQKDDVEAIFANIRSLAGFIAERKDGG